MPRIHRLYRTLLLIGLALAASAEEPQPVPIEQLEINREELAAQTLHLPAAPTLAEPTSALQSELHRILADEALALETLSAQLRTADRASAFAIERSIAELKQSTELELLRAQQRHALAQGAQLQAAEIEAAIEAILHPQPVYQKIERPLPVAQR